MLHPFFLFVIQVTKALQVTSAKRFCTFFPLLLFFFKKNPFIAEDQRYRRRFAACWKMETLWADFCFGLYNNNNNKTIKNHSDFSSHGYPKIQFKKVMNLCCC